jgi:hypothetical protein
MIRSSILDKCTNFPRNKVLQVKQSQNALIERDSLTRCIFLKPRKFSIFCTSCAFLFKNFELSDVNLKTLCWLLKNYLKVLSSEMDQAEIRLIR